MLLTATYFSEESSAAPEIISGVRASSIKIESTSSTIAKLNGRCTISERENFMLSRK